MSLSYTGSSPVLATMKKVIIILTTLVLVSCKKNPKAYQIIVTPEKEYYTKSYTVDLDSNCIEFMAYDGTDSSWVKVCSQWDVKPNPDYQK